MNWFSRHPYWTRIMGIMVALSLPLSGLRMVGRGFETVGFTVLGLGIIIPLVVAVWVVVQKERGKEEREGR